MFLGLGIRLTAKKSAGALAPAIGGYRVGDSGEASSIYEGYELAWGDDYNALDILGPAAPAGKYWTTIPYFPGTRARETQLWPQYEMDPLHTGYADSNMGVPVGSQNVRVADSVLTLQARKATAGELPHLRTGYGDVLASDGVTPIVRKILGASHSAWGNVAFNPGAPGAGEIILDFRFRYPVAAANPGGAHPSLWTIQVEPVNQSISTNQQINLENGGPTFTNDVPAPVGAPADTFSNNWSYTSDGNWHTLSFIMQKGDGSATDFGAVFCLDGVPVTTLQRPYNVAGLLTSFILSSHVVGNGYNEANWLASADGFAMEVDWVRVWRRPGTKHYRPLAPIPSVNVDFGQTAVITLPSKAALWGEAVTDANEIYMSVMHEENEPYGSHTVLYSLLPNPTGTVNDPVVDKTGRTITLPAGVLTRPGRLNMIAYAKAAGCVSEAARFAVNVGPALSVLAVEYEVGVSFSFDLYDACDCGVLTSNGSARAKTITVGGLPAWASYNDATGLITGTPTDTGNSTLSVSCTNSIGQVLNTTLALNKKATAVTSFSTAFTAADANLEDAGLGFTRLDGTAGGGAIRTNALRAIDTTSAGTSYASPQLTPGSHYWIEVKFVRVSDTAICHRLTDRNNHLQLRQNSPTLLQCYRRVGGTLTLQAAFTLGTALTASDVVRFEDLGSTFAVKVNGTPLTPSSGSLTITTAPPASDRQGVICRNAGGVGNNIDDFASGII